LLLQPDPNKIKILCSYSVTPFFFAIKKRLW
jgi:hypothetical protein